jgi:ribosomal protein S17
MKKKWERKYEKCRKQRRLYQIKQNKKKYIKKTHKIEVLETEGLSEQKNVSPVMKIKQTAISQFSFFC